MKLSLCLEMLFTDRPFIERLATASRIGYRAIEFWDWRDKDLPALADEAAHLGLTVAAMSGNRQHGLIDLDATAKLIAEMDQVFAVAWELNCCHIMMLSDVLGDDGSVSPVSTRAPEEKIESMVENLRALAGRAETASVTLLLEPLNTALDHRGCFLNHSAPGVEIVRRVDSPRVKLLYDIYHMQIMEGDVIRTIRQDKDWIAHFHTGGVPGRHELDETQELQWRSVCTAIADLGYTGYVAHEFVPTRDPLTSLREAVALCDV